MLQDKRTNRYWNGSQWIDDIAKALEFTNVTAAERCCCENHLDAVALAVTAGQTYKLQIDCTKPPDRGTPPTDR